MSDQKKPTKSDELVDIRSLIGDAKAGSFSLDDILAEYGSGKEKGKGAMPVRGKVLSFPNQPPRMNPPMRRSRRATTKPTRRRPPPLRRTSPKTMRRRTTRTQSRPTAPAG